MSKVKVNMQEKTDKELRAFEQELRTKITQARIDLATKKSNDVKQIKRLKLDLARSLTVLKQRELAAVAKTKPESKDNE